MKRWLLCGIVTVLLLCFVGGMSAAASGNTAEYVFSQDNKGYLFEQTAGELTFWEAPNVLTGQTRSGGVITLRNTSDRTVDFELTSVSLPYGDEAALTYLDAVTLVIEQEGEEVYHAPITRLMDSDRAPIVITGVPAGESRELKLSVSCAFTYAGAVPSYESLVWTFAPTLEPGVVTPSEPTVDPDPLVDWMMVAEITGVMFVTLVVTCVAVTVAQRIARVRRNKRK